MSLYQIVVGNDSFSYISSNTGSNWTSITQTPSIVRTITGNTNGTFLAISSLDTIHISTNSGTTWTQLSLTTVGESSSMSGDGTKLIVNVGGGSGGIYLYTYNGATWSTTGNIKPSGSTQFWQACTISTNGLVLYVGTYSASGTFYKSINDGTSWTPSSTFNNPTGDPIVPAKYWSALTTNSDGTKVLAADQQGYVYLSNDSGATFVAQLTLGSGNWGTNCLNMTPDGLGLIACAGTGFVWISSNGGSTWIQQTQANMGSRNWLRVSCSSDFQVLGAVVNGGYVYLSTNSGSTWTEITYLQYSAWHGIVISDLSGICFRETTRVLMSDGTFKAIKDIQRGDKILTDKKKGDTKKVARTLKYMATGKATEIPMHLIGNRRTIVCSSTHPFWINDKRRILAGDIEGTETIEICEWLYTIQFEDEGTYYVEGVKVDAVSPNHRKFKLPKELYFDQTKYKANRVMKSEDDERRKKPNMTKTL